ncbi:hypothetical protein N2600_04265 [Rhizobium sp. WSM1274]|uniref:hypothetical protein n=1 Tax=Rhizobium sp. WSM1274 TaxID=3138254 RepID=UPI0021A356E4|nr:hypothetical protein [Rhizobium leguminosarum]UWU29191.1 hypothetical protein N2600_04265 [Rhizobium leguminosarum bv. viciae]
MPSAFETGLTTGNLGAIRACPKCDLHNHALLGGNRQFVEARTGRNVEPLQDRLNSMAEMHDWVGRNVGAIFEGWKGRLLAFEAAFIQAREDGVIRLEVGEDVWAITLFDGSADRLTYALRHIHETVAPEIEWVPQLGMSRHCPVSALERWIAPFLDLGTYRTLDHSGDEFAQSISVFKPIYRRAGERDLRLKAHVGEWGTADDVWRAVEELELDEVQHGIAAVESSAVMGFLADHRIRLNICPTSNAMLGRVKSLASHPIRRLYDAGVVVTINTDDVLVFGQGVSEEFMSLFDTGLFAAGELDRIRLNGLLDDD